MWFTKPKTKTREELDAITRALNGILQQLPDELKRLHATVPELGSALTGDLKSHKHINRMIVDDIREGGSLDLWISKVSSDTSCPEKVIHILTIIDRLLGRNTLCRDTWDGVMEMLGTTCRMYGNVTPAQWIAVYEKHPILILYRLLELRTTHE